MEFGSFDNVAADLDDLPFFYSHPSGNRSFAQLLSKSLD